MVNLMYLLDQVVREEVQQEGAYRVLRIPSHMIDGVLVNFVLVDVNTGSVEYLAANIVDAVNAAQTLTSLREEFGARAPERLMRTTLQ